MGRVNLYSDTQTRPTPEMRRAMAEAEVGDEQHFGDPTVNALCERVAELLGFEAAVFLPSGTMCNAIGFRLHIRAGGDEAYLHRISHPIKAEAGGPAAISGAVLCPLEGERGMFDAATLAAAMRPPDDRYQPRSRLVSVEQTTNLAGGHVWPLAQLREVVEVAKANGLRLHMDGARLMNAVVASGIPTTEWTAGFDTAWIDFSKGLGAPMGAVLAGSRELIDEAWRYKQMMGGALRQAGHRRGRRAVGARPPRRAARDGPRQRAARWRAGWRTSRASTSTRATVATNIVDLPRQRRAGAVHPARGQRRDHGRARRAHGARGHPPRRRRGGHRDRARRRRQHARRGLAARPIRAGLPVCVSSRASTRSSWAWSRPGTYGHVGGLAVYDPSTAPGGTLEIGDVCRMVSERLHLLPPFRWRLVEVPFGIDLPYWVEDPAFDLDFHIRESAVPPPGDDRQLAETVARIFARPLDRSRPLWELYLIHGLPEGRVAMLTKLHHSMVDGVSGNEILGVLLDPSPEGKEIPPAPSGEAGERVPGDLEMLGRGLLGRAAPAAACAALAADRAAEPHRPPRRQRVPRGAAARRRAVERAPPRRLRRVPVGARSRPKPTAPPRSRARAVPARR